MPYDSPVTVLLENAALGAESAWRELFIRYSPLVYSVCRGHGVLGTDADDVNGNVWLCLVRSVIRIRQPEALPGWLATTARRECLKLLRDRRRQVPDGTEIVVETEADTDAALLEEERRNAVRDAFDLLPQRDRVLLAMLFADPPATYTQISRILGIPVGAIGPTRQRCLARARRIPSIAALLADAHVALPTPRTPLQRARRAG
jgi:RNA polymerase sigma factor (sigma-70 family)